MTAPVIIPPLALERLDALCDVRARPPVIRALIPQLPEAFVARRWEERVGKRPSRGPLPHTVSGFFATPGRRLEATYVLVQFRRLQQSGIPDVDALIQVFHDYMERYVHAANNMNGESIVFGGDQPLTFDRLWCLVRGYTNHRTVLIADCGHCGGVFVHSRDEVPTARLCPVRSILKSGRSTLAEQPDPTTLSTPAATPTLGNPAQIDIPFGSIQPATQARSRF